MSAFTWAHDDQVVVLAAGGDVAVGRVVHTVPPLFLLASYRVWGLVGGGNDVVENLPLPTREKAMVLAHNDHIIQVRVILRFFLELRWKEFNCGGVISGSAIQIQCKKALH